MIRMTSHHKTGHRLCYTPRATRWPLPGMNQGFAPMALVTTQRCANFVNVGFVSSCVKICFRGLSKLSLESCDSESIVSRSSLMVIDEGIHQFPTLVRPIIRHSRYTYQLYSDHAPNKYPQGLEQNPPRWTAGISSLLGHPLRSKTPPHSQTPGTLPSHWQLWCYGTL